MKEKKTSLLVPFIMYSTFMQGGIATELAYLVCLLHIAFAAFVVITPFMNGPHLLILLHALVVPCMLFHWYLNNDMCFLTVLERFLRGIDDNTTSFFHSLVSPIYKFPEHCSKSLSKIIWLLAILLGVISWCKVIFWYRQDAAVANE